jgi:antitoxin (DNA-binding transcriptional repressor) of toxin-antitoxin stability system
MEPVKVQYAKTHLSALLAAVERGEEIVIARGDQPVARLVAIGDSAAPRPLGFVAYSVPDVFFEPLPSEELSAWEGGE